MLGDEEDEDEMDEEMLFDQYPRKFYIYLNITHMLIFLQWMGREESTLVGKTRLSRRWLSIAVLVVASPHFLWDLPAVLVIRWVVRTRNKSSHWKQSFIADWEELSPPTDFLDPQPQTELMQIQFQNIDHHTDHIDPVRLHLVARGMMEPIHYSSEVIQVGQAEMDPVACLRWEAGSKLWVALVGRY